MIGAEILAQARGLIGTPWRHLGRTETGLDCIGLVLVAAARAGLVLRDPAPYPRHPQGHELRRAIAAHLDLVPIADARDGDVLLCAAGRWGGHVGLASTHPVYGASAMVHAYQQRDGVREDLRDGLPGTITGAFRWRES